MMGVKRTGDLLEKLTWGLAITLIVLSLGTHMIGGSEGPARSINQQRAQQVKLPASPAPAPAAPVAPAPAPANTPAQ